MNLYYTERQKMHKDLIDSLIKQGLITQNTELKGITNTTTAFSGTNENIEHYVRVQSIQQLSPIADTVTFNCTDIHGKGSYTMSIDNIYEIEGMTPDRFAECYNMTVDGSYKNPGKKRGRKPKK